MTTHNEKLKSLINRDIALCDRFIAEKSKRRDWIESRNFSNKKVLLWEVNTLIARAEKDKAKYVAELAAI